MSSGVGVCEARGLGRERAMDGSPTRRSPSFISHQLLFFLFSALRTLTLQALCFWGHYAR